METRFISCLDISFSALTHLIFVLLFSLTRQNPYILHHTLPYSISLLATVICISSIGKGPIIVMKVVAISSTLLDSEHMSHKKSKSQVHLLRPEEARDLCVNIDNECVHVRQKCNTNKGSHPIPIVQFF